MHVKYVCDRNKLKKEKTFGRCFELIVSFSFYDITNIPNFTIIIILIIIDYVKLLFFSNILKLNKIINLKVME